MGDGSGSSEQPPLELDTRVKFLLTELAMCFTYASIATTRLEFGNQESAKRAIRDAEYGYEMISDMLADPKHVAHVTGDQIREFTAELQRLRELLDRLQSQL